MATTEKISVSIGRTELRQAKRLASRLGLSMSMFVTEAVRQRILEQQRREAAQAVLATFEAEDRASPDEMAELLSRWGTRRRRGTPKSRSRRRSRST